MPSRVYQRPRAEVVRLVEATLALVSITVDDETLLRCALEHYGRRGLDWPDAHLVALVETRHLDSCVSVDRLDAKPKALSVQRREP